jgi:hypothetical protein
MPKPIKDPNRPNCIIVDIDGTLANKSPDRGYYDWSKVGLDTVNEHIKSIVNNYNGYIFIFSGREGSCYPETKKWLIDNNINHNQLIMRAINDDRSDDIVKREMFESEVKDKYNVDYIIDDRMKVIKMWTELGLPVISNNPLGLEY